MMLTESSSDEMDLEEIDREQKFQQDLYKSLKSWNTWLKISHDVSGLTKEMHEVISECLQRGCLYLELNKKLSQAFQSDQLQLQSYITRWLAIKESFISVNERGSNFRKKFHQLVQTNEATWKEVEPIAGNDMIEEKTREDPEGVVKTLEESSTKVEEVKACFENLKAEWNAMKQSFYADLDGCIRRTEALLQVVQREKQGADKE